MDALGRGLLREFPNPERVGCPGADVLQKIASHEMPLSDAEKWLDHLGSCSPCYADFKRFQEAHVRRNRTFLAAAAGILLAVSAGGWTLYQKHNENLIGRTAVVDLRDRSVARGTESNPDQGPLEVHRTATQLYIYLPMGSADGSYDVQIATLSGESLLTSSAQAKLKDGIVSLQIGVSLARMHPGKYTLHVRKGGLVEWSTYPLVIH